MVTHDGSLFVSWEKIEWQRQQLMLTNGVVIDDISDDSDRRMADGQQMMLADGIVDDVIFDDSDRDDHLLAPIRFVTPQTPVSQLAIEDNAGWDRAPPQQPQPATPVTEAWL